MRGKAIIPLVLGLCVGLLAVKFGVNAIQNARGSVPTAPTVKAVRAELDINAYETITDEMVKLVETADNDFISERDRVSVLKDVIGRVTAKAIPKQSPVLLSMLAPPGTPAGMVGRIPPGYRAVSVRIDEVTGVAYQIQPGDHVDVIVVMDITGSGRQRKRETIAEVILQNIKVAAIGQDTSVSSGAPPGGAKVKPARSATLLVAEEDVPKLHLAATRGKITLAMRGDADTTTTPIESFVRDSDVIAALRQEEPEVEDLGARPDPAPVSTTQIARVEPEAEPEPYSVLVCRGSTVANLRPVAERIVFEHAGSTNIIGTSEGLVGSKAVTLSAKKKRAPSLPEKQQDDAPAFDDQEPGDEGPSDSE